MYRKILVALENSSADESLISHMAQLAPVLGSELLLVHVADGWAARNFNQLKLTESEEMKADRAYLEKTVARFHSKHLNAAFQLALGDPAKEIVKIAEQEHCDLIAMASHGHRLIGDLIFGSTTHQVRHATAIPVLIVRREKQ
jgi:manganese transport protein